MRKLWAIPIVFVLSVVALWAYGSWRTPTPSEIIRQEHAVVNSSLPSIPSLPTITVPQPKPVSRHGVVAKTSRKVVPTPIPYVAEEPSVVTPVRPDCIFPLSLIPGCHPQEAN